jgi:hypothetical protein
VTSFIFSHPITYTPRRRKYHKYSKDNNEINAEKLALFGENGLPLLLSQITESVPITQFTDFFTNPMKNLGKSLTVRGG